MPVTTEFFDHRFTDNSQVAASSVPQAIFKFGPVPQGFIWYVETIDIRILSGTHTGTLALFTGQTDAPDTVNFMDRLDWSGTAAQDITRDYVNPRVVKPGEFLLPVVVANGGTLASADQVKCTVQIAWCLPNAGSNYGNLSWRERASLLEQEEVESMQRKNAVVVGGSGWNAGVVVPDDMEANGFDPWASRDPADSADNPAEMELPPGIGQYVGGNDTATQHPTPPYDGRILPDGSTDSTS